MAEDKTPPIFFEYTDPFKQDMADLDNMKIDLERKRYQIFKKYGKSNFWMGFWLGILVSTIISFAIINIFFVPK